jgi:hypothetical protein
VRLLAIDPGSEESAWVVYDDRARMPLNWGKHPNEGVLSVIYDPPAECRALAIEMVASYGMAVGATVFETCVWAGRFIQLWQMGGSEWGKAAGGDALRVYRRDVKLHLCGSMLAKDPNIRQALIDRYGPGKDKAVGFKATPGPLYGMKADCWSALAVAITAAETMLDARAAA